MATISRDAVPMPDKSGTKERRIVAYTGPVYATGGDSLTPESVALKTIDAIVGMTISNGTNQLYGWYDRTNKKIKWFSATATETNNGTDLTGYTGNFEIIGR